LWRDAGALDDKPSELQKPSNHVMATRIQKGARFVNDDVIPRSHWKLITQCWSQEPFDRPSFADILKELMSNRDWVIEGTDEELLAEYEAKVLKGLTLD
jgi:hypothetical protein